MNIDDMVGMVFTKVEQIGDEAIIFTDQHGSRIKMYHSQDCCEHVSIEDINGDLQDLVDTPILVASERSYSDDQDIEYRMDQIAGIAMPLDDESQTWTFYAFRTIKGSVDIRWYGSSNGYYSEGVDLVLYASKEEFHL